MDSNGNSRSGLLTAGGVLSIIGGALEVIGGGTMVGLTIANIEVLRLVPPSTYPGIIGSISAGVSIFALGIVAIIGGVSAMRRKIFGLSLAGAICCTLPSSISFGASLVGVVWAVGWMILGILAIIFISMSKKEFEVERKVNGI
jgi:hypothetical protein